MDIISIYSGCGGMDLGFKKSGFKTVYATDNWEAACNTLLENKISKEVVKEDIRNLDFKRFFGKVDGVIGGPPCPPYSQTRHYLINKNKGFEDKDSGFAVPEFFRVVKEVSPKFFFFENVDGFNYKTHIKELEYLIQTSDKLGYNVSYQVINCADYGVPQTRKRFICIGFKKKYGEFIFPKPTHANPLKELNGKKPWVTCGDVLSDFDDINKTELKQRPGAKHNYLLKDIPPGDNYLFFTEKRGYPKPIFKWKSRYWTFLLKLTPARPSWTIQASFSNNQGPFHWRNRFLRIEEIKKLQTIDDDYAITGNFKTKWKQIGNALPVKIAEILSKEIKKQIL